MEEAELVQRARTGDVDAFTELVRRYQAMAFGYAYARIGDFHLAEDTAQQAFIAAWRGLAGLKQPERFGGWLRSIVRFECAHLLRARRGVQAPIEHANAIATTRGPAETAEERDGYDRILAAINGLPQPEREVTILYYIQDHSQRDVAAFLNLPVTTVNNRLRAARAHLKEGRSGAMATDAFNDHRLPDDFATRIGEVIRTRGSIVDARFAPEHRPRVLNALTVDGGDAGPSVTVEAIQHLDETLVRCIAPTSQAVRLDAGMRVINTGGPVSIPLDRDAITQVIATLPETASGAGMAETGIKVIDLLCPLPARGRVALVGAMQTGKMVLVEEVIQRLVETGSQLSIFVFIETPDEVAVVNALDYRTSASVEAIYLPVADADPAALEAITSGLDAVITFSRELAARRFYPAIDPVRSTSRLLDPDIAGAEHVEIATRVRALLGSDDGDARAERLRSYLTQPFFVTEEYTHRPGQSVPQSETIRDCAALLDGAYDDLPDDALFMVGSLEDARDAS